MQVYTGSPISPSKLNEAAESRAPAQAAGDKGFQSILQSSMLTAAPLQFSRHANTRLSSREISLSADQLKRVESAVSKAREKGIKDSLVLVDDVALVVNVKNKTVITAMSGRGDNIFTNIDGAVIV